MSSPSIPSPAAAKPRQPESVTFIIPTLMRPQFLRLCLTSIAQQTVAPLQVLVGIRCDDEASRSIVKEFSGHFPISSVEAKGVGVVGSMNTCLSEAGGDLIALVDDDVELPPRWLETMLGHLAENPDVLGAAGRDFLQDHPDMRRAEATTLDVGRFYWYGRITGNHHRAGGPARKVNLLRGSNCLFRSSFLKSVGIESGLMGKGAQVHWELALALHAKSRGQNFFFDPSVEVVHNVAPRHDDDQIHRGLFSHDATVALAFNESYVVLKHGRGRFRMASLAWQFLIGSTTCPGIGHLLRQILHRDRLSNARLKATVIGRLQAVRAASKSSGETPPIPTMASEPPDGTR